MLRLIKLTKIDGAKEQEIYLNTESFLMISSERYPDRYSRENKTQILLMSGDKVWVKESVDKIIKIFQDYCDRNESSD